MPTNSLNHYGNGAGACSYQVKWFYENARGTCAMDLSAKVEEFSSAMAKRLTPQNEVEDVLWKFS